LIIFFWPRSLQINWFCLDDSHFCQLQYLYITKLFTIRAAIRKV
jgi:hypothetical protein